MRQENESRCRPVMGGSLEHEERQGLSWIHSVCGFRVKKGMAKGRGLNRVEGRGEGGTKGGPDMVRRRERSE